MIEKLVCDLFWIVQLLNVLSLKYFIGCYFSEIKSRLMNWH